MDDAALLVAGKASIFAVTDRQVERINGDDGIVAVARGVDPPLGGRSKATTLSVGEDLLLVEGGGLSLLAAEDLQTRWHLPLELGEENDAVQQVVYSPPWIVAASNDWVLATSDRGELRWVRSLPKGARTAGSHPLAVGSDRAWLGLVETAAPARRFLRALSLADGQAVNDTVIADLAMFCPAHVTDDVLVLETPGGLVAFDVENDFERSWALDAPVATGACAPDNGHLVVGTRGGTLLRVALADGHTETLVELPRRLAWVPPAPDLEPSIHEESEGTIESLALLPQGVAFSVTKPARGTNVYFHPWRR